MTIETLAIIVGIHNELLRRELLLNMAVFLNDDSKIAESMARAIYAWNLLEKI